MEFLSPLGHGWLMETHGRGLAPPYLLTSWHAALYPPGKPSSAHCRQGGRRERGRSCWIKDAGPFPPGGFRCLPQSPQPGFAKERHPVSLQRKHNPTKQAQQVTNSVNRDQSISDLGNPMFIHRSRFPMESLGKCPHRRPHPASPLTPSTPRLHADGRHRQGLLAVGSGSVGT